MHSRMTDERLRRSAHRARIARGELRRTISVSSRQLDDLERRGYLDTNDRGEVRAECEAIETFIVDSLLKP